ncbi:MAG: hypothetical protein ABEJ99_05090 [Candidatus Nanohaloarchaea archaeon]
MVAAAYATVPVGIAGEIDIIQFVTFVIGFSIGLAFFSALRDRYS